ncbi:hypothetical protein JD969_16315 [Planctomycetota bacterium]|nr:hypothetical protein JD969_16315 [Planctomycetota bacterium]
MRKVLHAIDVTGHDVDKGDTVTTLNGQMTARVCDIALDDDVLDEEVKFVCLRPIHQPYARGIWYSADQVMWVSKGRKRKTASKDTTEETQKVNAEKEAAVATV